MVPTPGSDNQCIDGSRICAWDDGVRRSLTRIPLRAAIAVGRGDDEWDHQGEGVGAGDRQHVTVLVTFWLTLPVSDQATKVIAAAALAM